MVSDANPSPDVPLSHLPVDEKAKRASSFGGAASLYERFRPGPPEAAVDWLLPKRVATVVDLGAGTGALTRLLVDRADDVIAIEPDERMREVLTAEVPGVQAVDGKGESMPIPEESVDAVLASSSWHWMDPIPALHEVARVLIPRGTFGALWAGPDPDGPFITQARELLSNQQRSGAPDAGTIMGDGERPWSSLEIPSGVPFDRPEQNTFTWDVALTADDLIGLLGTFSWFLTMDEDARERIFAEARRLLRVHDASTSFITGDKRVVDVDLAGQNLTACRNGTQANQFLISSGTANEHASFDGTFYIYRRVADEEMKSPEGPFAPAYYDIKHVPWTQYFDGGAALHGAWWHNNFGHPMSHGCINLQTPTANTKWPKATPQAEYLWNFDNLGDPVIVHGVTPGLTAAQQKSD